MGSHLCDRLLSDEYEVLCVDNYFSGAKQLFEKALAIYKEVHGGEMHPDVFQSYINLASLLVVQKQNTGV